VKNSRRNQMVTLTEAAREKLAELYRGKEIKPLRIVQEVT